MTEKYKTQCWYCGSLDMEDKGDYAQCRACGATYNYVPVLGADPLAAHGSYIKNGEGPRARRAKHPSKSVSLAAARVRKSNR